MKAQKFIDELSRRLRDVKKKQWDDEFLTSALNAALGALSTVMPQAHTINRDIVLVDGAEQTIDDDLHKIVTLLHNVATDGTPRRAITLADMSVFDASYPHWRQDPPRTYIRHWMHDQYDESKFYVWPPAGKFAGELPVVPDPPVEPIDPGPLAIGAPADYGPYLVELSDGNRINIIDPTLGPSFLPLENLGTVDITLPDTSDMLGLVHLDSAIKRGDTPMGASVLTSADGLYWELDSTLVQGSTLRIRVVDLTRFYVDGVDVYQPGATQEQIDEYQAAMLLYQSALSEYLEAVAAYDEAVARGASNTSKHIVRGTFTQTPHVGYANRPQLPTIPSEPVDPTTTTESPSDEEISAYQAALAAYSDEQASYDQIVDELAYYQETGMYFLDDELPVRRAHFQALQEFSLYYAYSIDDDMTANSGRAQRHWLAFFQLLNKREDANLVIGAARDVTE